MYETEQAHTHYMARHEILIYRQHDGTYLVPEIMSGRVVKTETAETYNVAVNIATHMERVYGATWDRLAHDDNYCACDYCAGVIN